MGENTMDIDFSLLDSSQANKWLMEFLKIVENIFNDSDNDIRLLANLLVMERYIHTLCQGLRDRGKSLSLGLISSIDLLWNYLEGTITSIDFQDFANDLYASLLAWNIGMVEDAPKEFYEKYFGNTDCDSYELLAIEWSSGLLMQLVGIAGGRLTHDNFDEFRDCKKVDFYGIDIMIHILEDACIEFPGISLSLSNEIDLRKKMEKVHQTPLFQQIISYIQKDLQTALVATPSQFSMLRNEYQQYTIIPEKYAADLLGY